MADLILTRRLARPDDFYAALIAAHDGLSDDASAAFNARLILILANHIGDHDVLDRALAVAARPEGDGTS